MPLLVLIAQVQADPKWRKMVLLGGQPGVTSHRQHVRRNSTRVSCSGLQKRYASTLRGQRARRWHEADTRDGVGGHGYGPGPCRSNSPRPALRYRNLLSRDGPTIPVSFVKERRFDGRRNGQNKAGLQVTKRGRGGLLAKVFRRLTSSFCIHSNQNSRVPSQVLSLAVVQECGGTDPSGSVVLELVTTKKLPP